MDADAENVPAARKQMKDTFTDAEIVQYFFAKYFTLYPETEDEESITDKELLPIIRSYYKKCYELEKIVTEGSPTVQKAREKFQWYRAFSSDIRVEELTFVAETFLLEYEMSEKDDEKQTATLEMKPHRSKTSEDKKETLDRSINASIPDHDKTQRPTLQDITSRKKGECIEALLGFYYHANMIEKKLIQNMRQCKVKGEADTKKTEGTDNAEKSEAKKLETVGTAGKGEAKKLETVGTAGKGEARKLETVGTAGKGEAEKLGTEGAAGKGEAEKLETEGAAGKGEAEKLETEGAAGKGEDEKLETEGAAGKGEDEKLETEGADNAGKGEDKKLKTDSVSEKVDSQTSQSENLSSDRLEFIQTFKLLIRATLIIYKRLNPIWLRLTEELVEKFRSLESKGKGFSKKQEHQYGPFSSFCKSAVIFCSF